LDYLCSTFIYFYIKYYSKVSYFFLGCFFQENRFRAKLATSALSTIVDHIDEKCLSYFTATIIKKQFQLTNNHVQHFRVLGQISAKVEYFVSTMDKNIQTKGEISLCDDNSNIGSDFKQILTDISTN
jgi:hypothetical protein